MGEDRYARQRAIPRWDQDRLAAATSVVVGVGALGNEVAKNLALLGVGRLVLCDPDVVAEVNLSRTVLFGPDDVGLPKAGAAAAALRRLVPGVEVLARPHDLAAGVGLGELADADVVLGCLDSRRARLRLLGRCALVEAALVDGGTHPWGGEVRVRLDTSAACFGCSFTPAERAEADVPAGCDADRLRAPRPASILTTSLVAAWMTLAAARLLLDEPLDWRFLGIDAATSATGPFEVAPDPTCPHHRPIGPLDPVPVGAHDTVGDLLTVLAPDDQPLSWTRFAVPASCAVCGDPGGPGRAGGSARCPRCSVPLPGATTQLLRQAPRDAVLGGLGFAPEDVVPVRLGEGGYRWLRLSR
ncbi:ThiF family adenylyltransferase [Saccharothrix longispora]|uniref:HesA/MoeB/ThiF family protein n=1 Tax=Saccharothrix longispora TaxID=33920 RepID=UPI0028FCFBC9|nr:ThiF family adenylyltransferase [Saccharothrix longispora]MBY8847832.1 ThiF family adenylyltransferase [Saccharothrix sp. MB29]MDU0291065.1 ThiF family adenylyltransferase [Saccharothrix longispora]